MSEPIPETAIDAVRSFARAIDLGRVRLVRRGPVAWFVRRVLRQGAMTLGHRIYFGKAQFDPRSGRSLALLVHELKHVEQFERLGRFGFFRRYAGALARNRFRYSHDLPLEAEAYEAQRVALEPLEAWAEERSRMA